MASHALTPEEAGRSSSRRPARRTVVQLGWPHYWLLTATLGGLLGLIAMVLLIATQT